MRTHVGVMAMLLAGCGSSPVLVDGGAEDAPGALDAIATDDASTGGPVAVTVYAWDGTGVVEGADVLFLTAARAVASRTTTGADGRATGVVPGGGAVLVVDGNDLTTILAVEAGDELVVGSTRPRAFAMNGAIVVPSGPAGTTRYTVAGACTYGSSTTTTITTQLSDACPPGARELLVSALAGTTRVGYLHAAAASPAPGTTIGLAGPWAAPATFAVDVRGVPASAAAVRVVHAPVAGAAQLSTELDSLPAPVGGVTTASLAHPPTGGDGTLIITYVDTAGGGFHRVATYHAGRVTSLTVADLGASLLPTVGGLAGDGGRLSWTLSAGAPYDGAVVTLDALEKGSSRATWRIVTPVGATEVVLPSLPADLDGTWAPVDGVAADVTLIESHVSPGRELRQTVFTSARDEQGGPLPSTVRTSSSDAEL